MQHWQYLPLLKSIPILLPLIHISLTGSVYTTVAVAVERYTTFVEALSKVVFMLKTVKYILSLYSASQHVSGVVLHHHNHCLLPLLQHCQVL